MGLPNPPFTITSRICQLVDQEVVVAGLSTESCRNDHEVKR